MDIPMEDVKGMKVLSKLEKIALIIAASKKAEKRKKILEREINQRIKKRDKLEELTRRFEDAIDDIMSDRPNYILSIKGESL